MAGIALVLDLLKRKNTCLGNHCVRHYDLFSATAAASSAASSFVVAAPFATWAFSGKGVLPVAYCDAGVAFSEDDTFGVKENDLAGIKEDDTSDIKEDDTSDIKEDDTSSIKELPGSIFQQDPVYYSNKEYTIQLKPLLSAFQWKNLALTSLRSFLLFYLPLLEQHATLEEDDDDFLQDAAEEQQPDLTVPLKKSLKQIVRDTIVVTTRRVLERVAVHYVSQRMAWKLLKDASTSATRKAVRKLPTFTYFYCVSRTTFRAQSLGILASWLVQVGMDIYRFFLRIFSSDEEADEADRVQQIQQLGGKVYMASLRCGASLVFASIGAGIGALLFKPSTGQWIGCAIGDLTGPVIVSYCFRNILNVDLCL